MKKKYLLILTVLFSLTLITTLVLLYTKDNIKPEFININLTDIQGQMEYINIQDSDNSVFLTYKETALGQLNNNSGSYSVSSKQFIYGYIYDLSWANKNLAIISFSNDPEELSNYTEYKKSIYAKDDIVFGVLNISEQSIRILPPGSKKVWMKENTIYGYDGEQILKLKNNLWTKTKIKVDKTPPSVSMSGLFYAISNEREINIYSGEELVYNIPRESKDYTKLRVLDSGELIYVDKSVIEIYKKNNNKSVKKISENDEVVIGKNIILYRKNNKNYIYKAGFNTFKRIDLKNFSRTETLDSFGLSEFGIFYIKDADNFEITLIRF